VLFVPHTTAGIVLQASGEGADTVAADIEAAIQRIVDEDGAGNTPRRVIGTPGLMCARR